MKVMGSVRAPIASCGRAREKELERASGRRSRASQTRKRSAPRLELPPVIVHTQAPEVILTEVENFKALVQKLTGCSQSTGHDEFVEATTKSARSVRDLELQPAAAKITSADKLLLMRKPATITRSAFQSPRPAIDHSMRFPDTVLQMNAVDQYLLEPGLQLSYGSSASGPGASCSHQAAASMLPYCVPWPFADLQHSANTAAFSGVDPLLNQGRVYDLAIQGDVEQPPVPEYLDEQMLMAAMQEANCMDARCSDSLPVFQRPSYEIDELLGFTRGPVPMQLLSQWDYIH